MSNISIRSLSLPGTSGWLSMPSAPESPVQQWQSSSNSPSDLVSCCKTPEGHGEQTTTNPYTLDVCTFQIVIKINERGKDKYLRENCEERMNNVGMLLNVYQCQERLFKLTFDLNQPKVQVGGPTCYRADALHSFVDKDDQQLSENRFTLKLNHSSWSGCLVA